MTKKTLGYVFYDGPSMIDGERIVAIACALDRSRNSKTGHMVQTYIIRPDASPMDAVRRGLDASICGTCRHRGNGDGTGRSCYVTLAHGPNVVFKAYQAGLYPPATPAELGQVLAARAVRVGTYGDPAALPLEVWQAVLAQAAFWTGYTHRWQHVSPAWSAVAMASADTLAEARAAQALGYRTFRVGNGRDVGEVICPASAEAGRKAQCAACRACMGTSGKARASIAIAPHGTGARYAQERATENA